MEIRDLLSPAPTVVVKDEERGAVACIADGEEVFVATPDSAVVERVGAGDAFAAGYLAARLQRRDMEAALRLGHLMAAAAMASLGDVPTALAPAEVESRLALDEADWAALRLG